MQDLKYWIGLNNFPKFGPVRFKKLINYFQNMEIAFKATSNELIKAGIEENITQEFITARVEINPDEIVDKLARENINVITIKEEIYPKLLKELYTPPPLLYYKGNFDLKNDFTLAVVGARKYTNYGEQVTINLVKHLAHNNLTIVSGLALGIDSLAHTTALENNGKTIAVLGSGLDKQNIYPTQNRYLADKIISKNGLIISEFPPGTPPLRHHFPQRNRIISGLSLGTLVIEASEKSGALITAKYSLDQNREVFAVPGNIYSDTSSGTNELIKLGAKVVTKAEDIIETLNLDQAIAYIDNKKIIPETPEEKILIEHLSHEPIHVDELARLTKFDIAAINSTLTIMEMKGMVKNIGSMQYILAR